MVAQYRENYVAMYDLDEEGELNRLYHDPAVWDLGMKSFGGNTGDQLYGALS